jgi:hypothetical protein
MANAVAKASAASVAGTDVAVAGAGNGAGAIAGGGAGAGAVPAAQPFSVISPVPAAQRAVQQKVFSAFGNWKDIAKVDQINLTSPADQRSMFEQSVPTHNPHDDQPVYANIDEHLLRPNSWSTLHVLQP